MNKKGFTLVELLAVIVILGVVAMIFVPNTVKVIKENGIKVYKIKEKELLRAAKDYAEYDKNFSKPTTESPTKYITMPQLISGNYINKIIDSTSLNECTAFVKVTTNSINGYNYEPCLICDNYTTDKSFCTTSTYDNL